MCVRALKHESYRKLIKEVGEESALGFAAQHWFNSIKFALKDKPNVDHFYVKRFEDILSNPGYEIKKICDFVNLDFNSNMLPSREDKFPFGSKRVSRWYTIRANVKEKYLKGIEKKHVEMISEVCKEYSEKFNYRIP